jgi:hypothetical protein
MTPQDIANARKRMTEGLKARAVAQLEEVRAGHRAAGHARATMAASAYRPPGGVLSWLALGAFALNRVMQLGRAGRNSNRGLFGPPSALGLYYLLSRLFRRSPDDNGPITCASALLGQGQCSHS